MFRDFINQGWVLSLGKKWRVGLDFINKKQLIIFEFEKHQVELVDNRLGWETTWVGMYYNCISSDNALSESVPKALRGGCTYINFVWSNLSQEKDAFASMVYLRDWLFKAERWSASPLFQLIFSE